MAEPRTSTANHVARLGEFLTGYLERRRADVKPASMLVLGHVVRNLNDFFGSDRDMSTIQPAEADDFARWLATGARTRGGSDQSSKGLGGPTIAKRFEWARTFFHDAVRRGLIATNVFEGVKRGSTTNAERLVYVDAATIERVIEATPSREWKLLISLARYLGLRIPSEAWGLKWSDVLWDQSRMVVHSPKTERYGRSRRIVPLLPEVRSRLDDVFANAAEGSIYVFDGLRDRGSTREIGTWPAAVNLRTHLLRLIDRAGVTVWTKLWANLRASAATDMATRYPSFVATAWVGHSESVAQQHYWKITDSHFDAAIQGGAESGAARVELDRNATEYLSPGNDKTPVLLGFAESRSDVQTCSLAVEGFESGVKSPIFLESVDSHAAESAAVHGETGRNRGNRAHGGVAFFALWNSLSKVDQEIVLGLMNRLAQQPAAVRPSSAWSDEA